MTELPIFAVGLFIMLVLAALTAMRQKEISWQIVRCAAAILVNWIAGTLYVWRTGDFTPWHFSIFIDAAAALAVMYHPAGRVQGCIGLFYLFQIAFHVAFGIRTILHMSADPIYYYDAITYIAWAQLAAMGLWCGGVWMGDFLHRLRHRHDAAARRARAGNSRAAP